MKKHIGTLGLFVLLGLAACDTKDSKTSTKLGTASANLPIGATLWDVPTDGPGTSSATLKFDSQSSIAVFTTNCLQSDGSMVSAVAMANISLTDKTLQFLQSDSRTEQGIDGVECRAGIQATDVLNYQISQNQLVVKDPRANKVFTYKAVTLSNY